MVDLAAGIFQRIGGVSEIGFGVEDSGDGNDIGSAAGEVRKQGEAYRRMASQVQ